MMKVIAVSLIFLAVTACKPETPKNNISEASTDENTAPLTANDCMGKSGQEADDCFDAFATQQN